MSKIFEIFGQDAHKMTMSLMSAADVASKIPKGASIALKPNLVLAKPPEQGATTHAGALSGCLEYLQRAGFRDLFIIESSWTGGNTAKAFDVCGYGDVCQKYHVPFYDVKEDDLVTLDTPFRPIDVSKRVASADYLIDLPVLKGHCQTKMTCALKNLKGCLPDREKRKFHADGLFQPIAALGVALKPDLVIVDSICGDLDFEEGGTPVQTDRMFLGFDAVQIDAYGCRLMGLSLSDVPYIGLAERWGAGSSLLQNDDIISLNAPDDSAPYPAPSGVVRTLTKNVHADRACSACYAALVRALYLRDHERAPFRGDIYIGQGWRGKQVHGLGCGTCCCTADACVKGCPPDTADILSALKKN